MSPGAQRLQVRRTRGWRKPAGAVYVGRPTRWGNPYRAGPQTRIDAHEAVARYAADLVAGRLAVTVADVRRELAGRDLLCWCAVGSPCHADVLLAVANGPPGPV